MSTKYKQKNPFSEFCKEEGQVVINIIIIAIITPYFAFGHASLAILCGVLFKLFSDLFSFIKKRAHISMRPQFLFN